MNFSAFLASAYWFDLPPSFNTQRLLMYGVVLGVLFLLGIVFHVASQKAHMPGRMRKLFRLWRSWSIVGSLFGLLFVFFRYQYVPILSYRAWFGLWLIIMIVSAVWIVMDWRKAKMNTPVQEKKETDTFLPKPKSRKK